MRIAERLIADARRMMAKCFRSPDDRGAGKQLPVRMGSKGTPLYFQNVIEQNLNF